jgi:hypothetical protein
LNRYIKERDDVSMNERTEDASAVEQEKLAVSGNEAALQLAGAAVDDTRAKTARWGSAR